MNPGKSKTVEALGNRIILERIFAHLPTSFLLSTCSFVNKTWNRETRTFIRNLRNCTIRFLSSPTRTLCQFFRQLAEICGQMTQAGRVIHFNTLWIEFSTAGGRGCCRHLQDYFSMAEIIPNSFHSLKLQYWRIFCCTQSEQGDCPVHQPLLHLLRHSSCELKRLEISGFTLNLRTVFSDLCLHFPKLEHIQLSRDSVNFKNIPDVSEERAILKSILDGAPSLRRIIAKDPGTLEILPQDKYEFLSKMKFSFKMGVRNRKLLRDILSAKPGLEELDVGPTFCDGDDYRSGIGSLEDILKTCCRSLRTINFRVNSVLPPLSCLPVMSSLSSINLNLTFFCFDHLCNALASLTHLCGNAPGLGQVEIAMKCDISSVSYHRDYLEVSFKAPAPSTEKAALLSEAATAKQDLLCSQRNGNIHTLVLDLSEGEIGIKSLSQLQHIFPHPSLLELSINYTLLGTGSFMLFSQIWELWPNLKQLRVSGIGNRLGHSLDSEFCGIHEQEAEWLGQQDEDYLRDVQIVPVRPSLPTMLDLNELRIDLSFTPSKRGSEKSVISKVTELVVLNRMTRQNFAVTFLFQTVGKLRPLDVWIPYMSQDEMLHL